jgi:sugar fermentation stimulation protein A
MRFPEVPSEGRLIRRYKRFLAEVELADGSIVVAHCANTGSMLGCADPGSRVWLSRSHDPKRKLAWTWELVEVGGHPVGIHTGRSNALAREAIEAGLLPELAGYRRIRAEVAYGGADGKRSRIDLLLEADDRPPCWVEVKNVTAAVEGGVALFPDAVTVRGQKHLMELMERVMAGDRAALFFCVQRGDVREVRPADQIDPEYGRQLREALAAGVEACALAADPTPQEIRLARRLPVICP